MVFQPTVLAGESTYWTFVLCNSTNFGASKLCSVHVGPGEVLPWAAFFFLFLSVFLVEPLVPSHATHIAVPGICLPFTSECSTSPCFMHPTETTRIQQRTCLTIFKACCGKEIHVCLKNLLRNSLVQFQKGENTPLLLFKRIWIKSREECIALPLVELTGLSLSGFFGVLSIYIHNCWAKLCVAQILVIPVCATYSDSSSSTEAS